MSPTEDARPSTPLPLEGIRVLDLSRFIAGPLCGQLLGDMGADVIKVERPGGEDSRAHAPFVNGESLYLLIYNRNKYGVTLDTRHPEGIKLLKQLIGESDVLIENYRPGTLARMGLSHDTLLELNPRLVVTSISGFGQTGPLSERALFDAIAQAMSGLMSITGKPDDEPLMVGSFLADYIAGFYAALGTMFALFGRERTGRGQVVDVASVDALFSCLGTQPSAYAMFGTEGTRRGNRDQYTAPANLFRARDGYVYLHGGTKPLFGALTRTIGQPELADDPRFASVEDRMANVDAIEAIVGEWVAARTVAECEHTLGQAGIPVGPVAKISDVVDSDQIGHRQMMVRVDHPVAGPVVLPGQPIKMSGAAFEVRRTPPVVGADNDTVFGDLCGLTPEEVDRLRDIGAI